ncbi:MAG TPA: GTPase Era, partial [Anaerolineaceae bacterium]|nr:GTPase Era [Anaerolineaceae bacterium]
MAFKAGFVTIVGRPNVGKSTLLNGLMGQKIAAVSPRPQTTRRRQLGILSLENAQIVFVDTPGIHKPVHKLGEYMNDVALQALEDVDAIVWMVDLSEPPTGEDALVAEHLRAIRRLPRVILALNKIDRIPGEEQPARVAQFQALLPEARPLLLSATEGRGREELLGKVIACLPDGEPFYDTEQITDLYEREIAVELIREAALLHLRDEVPHCLAVRLDDYKERGEEGAFIAATLLVERDSQKGIVIGQGG